MKIADTVRGICAVSPSSIVNNRTTQSAVLQSQSLSATFRSSISPGVFSARGRRWEIFFVQVGAKVSPLNVAVTSRHVIRISHDVTVSSLAAVTSPDVG